MTGDRHKPTQAASRALSLVRAAFGQSPDGDLFRGMDDGEWKDVYEFSSRQGLLPLTYDGIATLPREARPAKPLLLTWGVNTEISAERYAAQVKAIESLARFYAEHGIRMFVFKGYGLSLYYPIPEHRECGDIDIYLFGDFEKGDRLISERGIHTNPENKKHTSFMFDGVMVENHRLIVNAMKNRRMNRLETLLEEMAAADSRKTAVGGATVMLPSATFNALYLLAHSSSHFGGGELAVRNMCDWARFLQAEGGNIDRAVFADALKRSHLDKLCQLMTAFGEDHLELPPQGLGAPSPGLKHKFEDMVLGYKTANIPPDEKLPARIRRIWNTRWRAGVLRESFVGQLLYVARIRRKYGR